MSRPSPFFNVQGSFEEFHSLLNEKSYSYRQFEKENAIPASSLTPNDNIPKAKRQGRQISQKSVQLFSIEDIPHNYEPPVSEPEKAEENNTTTPWSPFSHTGDNGRHYQTNTPAFYKQRSDTRNKPRAFTSDAEPPKIKVVKTQRFEDVQSEAMYLWNNGIDLSLEGAQQKKNKKASWLTKEEFASFSTAKQRQATQEAETSFKNASDDTTGLPITTAIPFSWSTDKTERNDQGHAPCYAPNTQRMSVVPLPQSPAPSPLTTLTTLTTTAMTNAARTTLYAQSSNFLEDNIDEEVAEYLVRNVPSGDPYVYQCLDALATNIFGASSLQILAQVAPLIMKNIEHQNCRTFAKLLQVVLLMFSSQTARNMFSIDHVDHSLWINTIIASFAFNEASLMTAVKHYVQSYMLTHRDVKLLLDFLVSFIQACPDAGKAIPMDIISQRIEQLQPTMVFVLRQDAKRMLNILHTRIRLKDSVADGTSWPTADIPQNDSLFSRDDIKDGDGWKVPRNLVDQLSEQLKSYLEQQLVTYNNYISSLINRVKHDTLANESLWDINSVVFRNVRRYPTILLAPVISDTATVYDCLGQNQNIKLDGFMGCVVLIIPEEECNDDRRSTIFGKATVVGTAVQFANQLESGRERYLLAVKHEDVPFRGSFSLILTTVKATPLLPLIDWLKPAQRDLDRSHFSEQLLPYVISLTNTQHQQTAQNFVLKDRVMDVPDYLQTTIDVSTIMVPSCLGCKANVLDNSWPRLQPKHLNLPPGKRPLLYSLSDSQVSALQYALSHRFALISGPPGTGKSYLAGKLVELTYQAIRSSYIHQPVLVLTSTSASLDSILSMTQAFAEDLVQFGNESENDILSERNVMKLTSHRKADSVWRKYRQDSRELETYHIKLKALEVHREHVIVEKQPKYLLDLMPPSYRDAFVSLYHEDDKNASLQDICKQWLGVDDTPSFGVGNNSTTRLYNSLLGRVAYETTGLQSIMERDQFHQQQLWIEQHKATVIPLSEGRQWPFASDDVRSADQVRYALIRVWSDFDAYDLWQLSSFERKALYARVLKVYEAHLEKMVNYYIQKQDEALAAVNDLRITQWKTACNFKRIIGMTTGFAMANPSFVNQLSPHTVIIDEAEVVSGALLTATSLTSSTNHIILLGDDYSLDSEDVNLPASLFHQWHCAGRYISKLKEQWRMSKDISLTWRAALSNHDNDDNNDDSIIIPILKKTDLNKVRGMKYCTYVVNYTANGAAEDGKLLDQELFVTHLTLYIYLQGYSSSDIVILANGPQINGIRNLVLALSKSGPFTSGFEKVRVDQADTFRGKEADIVVLFINSLSVANISTTLSRARKGLYIIGGQAHFENSLPLQRLTSFMEKQGLCSDAIPLRCQRHHMNEKLICHWEEFAQVRNGGCYAPCKALMDCGHVCQETCHHMSHSMIKCNEPCNHPHKDQCQHPCTNACYLCQELEKCPPCTVPVQQRLPCGHMNETVCGQQPKAETVKCQETIEVELDCGHAALVKCCNQFSGTTTDKTCTVTVLHTLSCGHSVEGPCGVQLKCTEKCGSVLTCGHSCQQTCSTYHNHERASCPLSCPKQLICGHRCAKGCANPDSHTECCLEKCERLCAHGYQCDRTCWEVCIDCRSQCPFQCPHTKCTKKCYEICDREPCEKACTKFLKCSHPCVGLCGEPCPTCPTCFPETLCSITLRRLSEFAEDEKVYTLPDCGCSFAVDALDAYFESKFENDGHTAIKLWRCPFCEKLVYTAGRYIKYVKSEFGLVNNIKEQQEKMRQQLTNDERIDIVNAMNEGIQNSVGGRWFVCKNRHPYFIGECGGATEMSKCPQCNDAIGGLQHQVVETNRFYGEFDGSSEPAWPGQPRSQ